MEFPLADVIKILLAVLAGGIIGMERELLHKAAGFRTMILICMGAALYTLISIHLGDDGRIASTVVTGIGFLGAGVIMHESNRVSGLTTAATIWLTAAIGMGFGAGTYILSIVVTIILLLVTRLFALFSRRIDDVWEAREYRITIPAVTAKIAQIQNRLDQCGLKGRIYITAKQQGHMICQVNASGATDKHYKFMSMLLEDREILEVYW